ncbi:MAG: class I SAM-dependent methyltransferase [Kofleriaceae bacterium]
MNDRESGRYWEANAAEWTQHVRRGFDESRDFVNSPAFFAMLPEIRGLRGLDLGCGEGHNTQRCVELGAAMTALDVAPTFVRATAGRGIPTVNASGLELPFAAGAFEFVTAFMSVMDMPEHPRVFAEVHRVLRPGGFFQFSISHPCFQTPAWEWLRDAAGNRRAVACGDYFRELDGDLETWSFGAARRAGETARGFQVPRFTHTLSTWLNLLLDSGFALERFCEPTVDAATAAAKPQLRDHQIIAYFLTIRARRN